MAENAKVTVRIDENGAVVGLAIDGEIDHDNLTEERPSKPPTPLGQDEYITRQHTLWAG